MNQFFTSGGSKYWSFSFSISPEYSLEELMLKLKLRYFGHLMRRTDSLEKALMLGRIEGRSSRGCHPTISSSVVSFSSRLQSFPASGSFQMSQLCNRWPKYWSFSFSINSSVFFIVQLSHPYMTTRKTIALTRWTFVGKVMSTDFRVAL